MPQERFSVKTQIKIGDAVNPICVFGGAIVAIAEMARAAEAFVGRVSDLKAVRKHVGVKRRVAGTGQNNIDADGVFTNALNVFIEVRRQGGLYSRR